MAKRLTVRFSDEEVRVVERQKRKHGLKNFSNSKSYIILNYERLEEKVTQLRAQLEDAKVSEDQTSIEEKTESKPHIPPCYYASVVEGKVYCDNPRKKGLPRDRRLPIQSCQSCFNRREAMRKQKPTETQIENEKQKQSQPDEKSKKKDEQEIVSRVSRTPDIEEILGRVGVCENPIYVRTTHSLACAVCRKKDPWKRQACDEILEELKMNPIAYRKFVNCMIAKLKKGEDDSYEPPESEEARIRSEKEFGLYDPEFEKIYQVWKEICENCERLPPKGECRSYCIEFKERLKKLDFHSELLIFNDD